MHDEAGQRRLHIGHLDLGVAAGPGDLDDAVVRELAAALGVERCPVEDHRDLRARGRGLDRHAAGEQPDDGRLAVGRVVAGEGDLAGLLEQGRVDGDVRVAGLLLPRVLLRPHPLLVHEAAEAVLVHGQALLGRHLQGEVDREPVSVVQLKSLSTRKNGLVLALGFLDRDVEDRGAGAERPRERRLFRVDDRVDVRGVAVQLGELLPHRVDRHRGQLVHEARGRGRAAAPLRARQQPQVADGAAQQPAEHVAAPLVARQDAVFDQHDRAAHVVGDDAE